MSAVGAFSMACTSPDSSAATRAGSLVSRRSVALSHVVFPPHQASFLASSRRSPLAKRTNLYGPVPIAALPLLKSSVVAPVAAFFEMMYTVERSFGSSGCGFSVVMISVCGSVAMMVLIGRTYVEKEDGEFGTFGTRSTVKITSSAVKSLPSCHLTPLRSLNSQFKSSTAFHDSARPGTSFCRSSIPTSFSNTCPADALFGPTLW